MTRNKKGQFEPTIRRKEVMDYMSEIHAQGYSRYEVIGMSMARFDKSPIWAVNNYKIWEKSVLTK